LLREFSAGGVVVDGERLAAIRPRGRREGHWALPKGAIDPGEKSVDAAVREVLEETGIVAEPVRRLEPIRYVYQRAGQRVFKVVTFWLMRPVGGELGAIAEEMRIEVAEATWLPLHEAPDLLAYRGERQLVAALLDALAHGI
jgi:8-oxo-dGTP pyrophosphatase MutT (NUDIX family)